MKALFNMVNKIGRFTYPIYFYANELKVKALTKRERTVVSYNWYAQSANA